MRDSMANIGDLPNVGKVLGEYLTSIGIENPEQLRQLGSKETFIRIRLQKDPTACLHMLYGLQGAIEGIPDRYLSAETKQELRAFFKTL